MLQRWRGKNEDETASLYETRSSGICDRIRLFCGDTGMQDIPSVPYVNSEVKHACKVSGCI